MPSITSTGVGSGLDVNSIVTSLMTLEQRPLALLQQSASSIQTRLSAFGSLKSQAAAFGDVARRLADPANWNPMKTASSNADAVSATGGAKAVPGQYRIEVQQLAQAQSLASAPFAGSSAVVGTGTLTIELGTTAGGAFTPRAGATPVTVAIGTGQQTLAGVRDAINAAKAGVTASIVSSNGQSQLVLRTADGADSTVRITASDDDGNATDTAGLSALAYDPAAAAGAGRNLTQTQAAQDAKFTLNGLALTSATNTVADVVEGLTLSLRQVTTSPVDVSAAVDTAAVRKNVTDFINAYNSLAKALGQQTSADGSTRGTLQADPTAVGMKNQLREMLRDTVAGLSGTDSLATAGIEVLRDGTLSIRDSSFAPLLDDPSKLAALFTQAQRNDDQATLGIGRRFDAWAKAVTGDAGSLAARMDGLQTSAKDNQKQQDAMQTRLAATEARLRAQYQSLDTQMSTLNAQMAQMRSALGLG